MVRGRMRHLLLVMLLLSPLPALTQMKIVLQYQDQFGKWQRYQEKHNEGDAFRTAKARAQGNSKRHRHCIGQQSLPLNLPMLQQLPDEWQHIAQTFRHCNAPLWNDDEYLNSS